MKSAAIISIHTYIHTYIHTGRNSVSFCCTKKNKVRFRGVFRRWIFHRRDAPVCVTKNFMSFRPWRQKGDRFMKLKRRAASLLLTACLVAGLMPTGMMTAYADTEVSYRYYDEVEKEWKTSSVSNYTSVVYDSTSWSGNNVWYVVNSNVTISDRITVSGTVNLILADGYTLTANNGIAVNYGNTLNIYGQTQDSGTVEAAVSGNNNAKNAVIGGNEDDSGGSITISGGTVTAITDYSGTDSGAGIGGGYNGRSNKSNITINGGTVKVTNGEGWGAGIGDGHQGGGSNITISGGTVEATGSRGAGIGSGLQGYNQSINIDISNGYVTTASSTGNVIGLGYDHGGNYTLETKVTGGYFADTNATIGDGGKVYNNTVSSGYSVCNNMEETKDKYPYLVCRSDDAVTVTWKKDSNTSETQLVKKGSTPVYSGDIPTKDASGNDFYTLYWSPAVSAVTADATYTAQYATSTVSATSGGSAYTFGNWAAGDVAITLTDDSKQVTAYQYSTDGGAVWNDIQTSEGKATLTDSGSTAETDYIFRSAVMSGVYGAQSSTFAVKIDKTAPTGTIAVNRDSFSSFTDDITYGYFFNQKYDIAITPEDVPSGVMSTEYLISETAISKDSIANASGWGTYSNSFQVTNNGKYIIYAKITDSVGNVTYISTDGLVFYTNAAQDTAAITFTYAGTGDVTAKVTLNGNTVSGISCTGTSFDKDLTADSDYSVDESGTITFKSSWLKTLAVGEYTLTVSYNPQGVSYNAASGNCDAPATTSLTLTVGQSEGSIIISSLSKTYDGAAVNPAVTVTLANNDIYNGTPAIAYYSLGDGNEETLLDSAPSDAGNYKVKVTINDAGANYTDFTASAGFTITAALQSISYSAATVTKTEEDDAFINELTKSLVYGDITYESSDTFVATVDSDGKVTIAGTGTATITAAVSGNDNYTAATASYTLIVETGSSTEDYYTITATAGEGGSITLTAANMALGGYAVYEIMPDDGYEIDTVTVDGTEVTEQAADGQYTFADIQENHTISVTFKQTETTGTETGGSGGSTTGTTTSGGSRSSSSDDDDDSSSSLASDDSGIWVQDGNGWRYVYKDGRYEAGTAVAGGDSAGQVSWKQIDGKWWAFGADGYLATGWVFDQESGLWYYVDETNGMKTGRHYDNEDGCWYYLDAVSGHMLTGWQWIDGKWYYFNEDSESPTWVFDGNLNKWIYDESTSHRPFGAMYADEETPDGHTVGKDGSREEAVDNEQQEGGR